MHRVATYIIASYSSKFHFELKAINICFHFEVKLVLKIHLPCAGSDQIECDFAELVCLCAGVELTALPSINGKMDPRYSAIFFYAGSRN